MKKLKQKNIIIIIAIILVIAIIVGCIFLAKKLNKKEEKVEEESEIQVANYQTEIDMTNLENCKIREDGMKVNTSSKIAKGIEFNDVFLKDITIESSGDMAVFNASVENNLDKDIENYIIFITFLNSKGEEIDTVETMFPDIPNGETGFITASTPKDIATADSIKIERQKI